MSLDLISDALDATEPYDIKMSPLAARRCKMHDPGHCAGVLSARHYDKNIEDMKIFRGVTYIKFRNQPLPLRYQNDSKLKQVAEANDLKGMKGVAYVLRLFKAYGEPFVVRCLPPRKAIQLNYLRDPERAKARNESARRCRAKPKSKRRKYSKPTANGLRSGQGLAHSWALQ